MIRSIGRFFILFLIVLLYLVFTNSWYEKEQLIINGSSDIDGVLDLQWDSGSGFNGYEKKRFKFNIKQTENQQLLIAIKYLGDRNSASLSSDIVCSGIRVDQKELDLSSFIGDKGGYQPGGILLNKHYKELLLSVAVTSSIEIKLLTNNRSGKVEILVGSNKTIKDLYIANIEAKHGLFQYWVVDKYNKFVVFADLPRYAVKTYQLQNIVHQKNILIDSVQLKKRDGISSIDLGGGENNSSDINFNLSQFRTKHFFNSVQFGFQLCFALIITWIVFVCVSILRKSGGIKTVFSGNRKIFWCFVFTSAIVYSFWLIAFWPGVMSVDSLKIWRAALLPEVFVNDHPVLNVVLYMFLAHIWQNPAVVPIFHISMMSLLTGHIFYGAYRQGVKLKYMVPFYFLLIFSIPVGLYNIVLWKDIPFAMLVVFWAFTLADLYRKKIDDCYYLSLQKKAILLLLLVALALTRHNGIIFLGVVPLLFILLGLVDLRKVFLTTLTLLVAAGGLVFTLKASGMIEEFGYFSTQAASYVKSILGTSPVNLVLRTLENYWGILNINQTNSKWDLWHFFLGDRQAYSFLVHAQWNDVYPYLSGSNTFLNGLREFCMQLYWKTYEVPWVYLTWNPFYILVILPLSLIFFKKFPLTAIFSIVILSQVLALLLINVFNWRYYYFVCLGGLFLGPLLLMDLARTRNDKLKTT